MMTTFLIHVDSKIYAKNRDKGGSYTGVFMTTQTTNHVAMTTHFLPHFTFSCLLKQKGDVNLGLGNSPKANTCSESVLPSLV